MDISYNPHAERARRKNRSTTNVNHLSLAPLTSKLPLHDDDIFDGSSLPVTTSYLDGRSAPTTPRLLEGSARKPRSRTSSRNRTPSAPGEYIPKSKSSSHIGRRAVSGTVTPRPKPVEDGGADGDWLLRTGALMAGEAREYKGQSWLVSRQSSTSLSGMRTTEEEVLFEQELARTKDVAGRRVSRRGSSADDDISVAGSGAPSRLQSRSQSIIESRSQIITPMDRGSGEELALGGAPVEPDFVDLDEKLEELERDTLEEDVADVKRLMKRNGQGKGSWLANMVGWSLFSVEEHEEGSEEDSDDESLEGDDDDDDFHAQKEPRAWLKRRYQDVLDPEELTPPPETNQGGWSDAAWLLSVATKVIF